MLWTPYPRINWQGTVHLAQCSGQCEIQVNKFSKAAANAIALPLGRSYTNQVGSQVVVLRAVVAFSPKEAPMAAL